MLQNIAESAGFVEATHLGSLSLNIPDIFLVKGSIMVPLQLLLRCLTEIAARSRMERLLDAAYDKIDHGNMSSRLLAPQRLNHRLES